MHPYYIPALAHLAQSSFVSTHTTSSLQLPSAAHSPCSAAKATDERHWKQVDASTTMMVDEALMVV
jgi:hypothetical protein